MQPGVPSMCSSAVACVNTEDGAEPPARLGSAVLVARGGMGTAGAPSLMEPITQAGRTVLSTVLFSHPNGC